MRDFTVNKFVLARLGAKLARTRLFRSYTMADLRGAPQTQSTIIKGSIPDAGEFLVSGTREEWLAKNFRRTP